MGLSAHPRIVLLHATAVAMEPVMASLARLWPEAEVVNLLDDGLTIDRAAEGAELSEQLISRFVDFGHYAHRIGADGILVTCSAFGPAIERMAQDLSIPVLKPNEAMFRKAIAAGGRIGMLATFAPSVPTMEAEFAQFVAETGGTAKLRTVLVADAIARLRQGDREGHNRLVAAQAPELADCDAVMLAHFSTSHAADAVRAALAAPVLSAPEAAVLAMRGRLSGH